MLPDSSAVAHKVFIPLGNPTTSFGEFGFILVVN